MRWSIKAVYFWIDYYLELKNYGINPWREIYDEGEVAIRGKHGHKSPTETLSILNAEFDWAVGELSKYEQCLVWEIIAGFDVREQNRIEHKIANILRTADRKANRQAQLMSDGYSLYEANRILESEK